MATDTAQRWLPVVGFEGLYTVSNHGRVQSMERTRTMRNRWGRDMTVRVSKRILQPNTNKDGHCYVALYRDGIRHQRYVHHLVLKAWIGLCPEGLQARHLNDVADDNRLENLKWGTSDENAQDRVHNGHDHNARKTHCPAGHEYTPTNTYIDKKGYRSCIACRREAVRKAHKKERDHGFDRSGYRYKKLRAQFRAQCIAINAPCHICDGGLGPIDYKAPANCSTAWELDHLIPIAERPDLAYQPTLFRASHSICNRRTRRTLVDIEAAAGAM